MWTVVATVAVALVVYGMGPLFEQRDQRLLLDRYRASIERAANEKGSLNGVSVPVKAPEPGDPVAILEIGAIQLQHVVVEGVAQGQTQRGPGHVPGTAGPGQAGNSSLVGRRGAYGGPFADLDRLRPADSILVTTTQGFSVYEVESVTTRLVLRPGEAPPDVPPEESDGSTPAIAAGADTGVAADPAAAAAAPAGSVPAASAGTIPAAAAAAGSTAPAAVPLTPAPVPRDAASRGPEAPPGPPISVDDLFGRTRDDQLTLVTSSSGSPLNGSEAVVVVARMRGNPYVATPQGGRTDGQNGLGGDAGALAALVLAAMGYAGVIATTVLLHRRSTPLVAHVLTTAPLLALTVVVAETIVRLLPAWV
jgi:hypothetical protein